MAALQAAEKIDNESGPSTASSGPPAVPPSWSVGVGIAIFDYTLSSVSDVDTAHDLFGWRPRLLFLVERRMSPSTRLLLDLTGSYLRREVTFDRNGYDLPISYDLAHVAAGVGVRRIFNPGRAVDVSGFITAAVGWSHTKQTVPIAFSGRSRLEYTYGEITYNTLFGGVELGMAVERALTEGLSLRLESTILTVNVQRRYHRAPTVAMRNALDVVASISDTEATAKATFFNAGISLSPSVQLLLTF